MELDYLQQPRLQAIKEQAESAQNEADKQRFLIQLVKAIVDAINAKTIDAIEGGVDVNNLDEIQAALRNELARANKQISTLLENLNLSTKEQTKITSDIQTKLLNKFSEYQTIVVKRVNDVVNVDNLDDINFPTQISVNNLKELITQLEDISQKISALKLNVVLPAPQVNVQPTPVNIPETVLNVPALDLSPLIESIERSLKLLRTNNKSNPLAVRITDGADWIKELKKQTAQTTQFMSDVSYIRNVAGQRINPATDEGLANISTSNGIGDGSKTVTTAGTRVQLSVTSVPCKYVIVVALAANTDTIWVGGSTVAAGSGRPIVSLQSEKLDINNLNKVYIDSVVNGEGVSFVYVV